MKNLFNLLLLLLVFSCSKDNVRTPEELNQTKSTHETSFERKGVSIDTTFFIAESRSSMASFVAGVGEYYNPGDTYKELKSALDPTNELLDITDVGNDLLYQAFQYLDNDVPEKDMSGEKIMIALQEILVRADEMGVKSLDNVDLDEGSSWLFGVDENLSLKGGCKWYQLGCHAATIWHWLTSTASGGATTNGQAVVWALAIVAAVIGFFGS